LLTAVTVSSRGKLARHLGVSVTMVGNYIDQGMPVLEDGSYDVEECLAWQAAMRASSGRPTKGDAGSENDLRERKLLAECEKLEQETIAKRMKNDLLAGELVYRTDVVAECADMLSKFKAILESIPDDIAKEAPGEQRVGIRAIAKQSVDRARHLMAAWRPPVAEPPVAEDGEQ
jgi:phage terminase Nu1 subunit (DNA packaging protein)